MQHPHPELIKNQQNNRNFTANKKYKSCESRDRLTDQDRKTHRERGRLITKFMRSSYTIWMQV